MVKRIITGVVLIGILVTALTLWGWFFAVPFMALLGMALYEVFRALGNTGVRLATWPVYLFYALSIPLLTTGIGGGGVLLALAFGACLFVTIHVLFSREPSLENILYSILPLFIVLLPGMCTLGLLRGDDRLTQLMLMIMAFAVPLAGDTLAYFIGVLWGRHKLCEKVSPHKTVEGAVAGLFGSILAGAVVMAFFLHRCAVPWWHYLLLGLIGGVAGQAGDLFASIVKRTCDVKDYGTIFPGHGGIMDRLDSVYWAAVVMYCYMTIFI